MAYSEKVIDHYENPRNVGKLDDKSKFVGTGMVGAPACGDVMRLQIQVNDTGVIEDAKFKKYVDVYAKDQKKFFVDFAAAFEKLEGLGTSGLTPLDA